MQVAAKDQLILKSTAICCNTKITYPLLAASKNQYSKNVKFGKSFFYAALIKLKLSKKS